MESNLDSFTQLELAKFGNWSYMDIGNINSDTITASPFSPFPIKATHLNYINLQHSNLEYVVFEDVTLKTSRFSGSKMAFASLKNVDSDK